MLSINRMCIIHQYDVNYASIGYNLCISMMSTTIILWVHYNTVNDNIHLYDVYYHCLQFATFKVNETPKKYKTQVGIGEP